jgi:type II secretory pathway pseudopilin PulG
MRNLIVVGVLALLLVGGFGTHSAQAETTSSLTQIQALMAQLESLQKQLAALKGEIRVVLKEGLTQGMSDDSIKQIQEVLATDSSLYPQGLVTGYFGPLTTEAVKKFQLRHELAVTGVVDSETRALLETYLEERHDGKVPTGLLQRPDVTKKIEMRYRERCELSTNTQDNLCKKLKIKYKQKDDEIELEIEEEDEDEDDEDEDEDEDEDN